MGRSPLAAEALTKDPARVPDPKHIRAKEPVQLIRSRVQERPTASHTGVVEQEINMAKMRPGALGQLFHRTEVRDIALHRQGPDARPRNLLGCRFGLVGLNVSHDDMRPFLGQRGADAFADTARAAGDNRDFIDQLFHRVLLVQDCAAWNGRCDAY